MNAHVPSPTSRVRALRVRDRAVARRHTPSHTVAHPHTPSHTDTHHAHVTFRTGDRAALRDEPVDRLANDDESRYTQLERRPRRHLVHLSRAATLAAAAVVPAAAVAASPAQPAATVVATAAAVVATAAQPAAAFVAATTAAARDRLRLPGGFRRLLLARLVRSLLRQRAAGDDQWPCRYILLHPVVTAGDTIGHEAARTREREAAGYPADVAPLT